MIITEPRCRHFGICGGCRHQNISYESQLAQKEAFVSECFGIPTQPILPSPSVWHYRNKMEFTFSQSRKGDQFLGLLKRRGRVENLEECYLAHAWFAETLAKVRGWWKNTILHAYHPPTDQGLLRTLTLRRAMRTGQTMATLTVSEAHFDEDALSSFIKVLDEVDTLILRKQITQKKIPTRFEEKILKGEGYIHEELYSLDHQRYLFRIKSASFFQPNTLQAEAIYKQVLSAADFQGTETVLDLYCGTGALGIFASGYAKQVLGVEIVPEAVEDARENLTLNHIDNMEVHEADTGSFLGTASFRPDVVLVDPPRSGLGPKAISQLNQLKPQKIIYVSCNPATQALDCRSLDYEIVQLQPIDQFPQTNHVENIAVLRRKA